MNMRPSNTSGVVWTPPAMPVWKIHRGASRATLRASISVSSLYRHPREFWPYVRHVPELLWAPTPATSAAAISHAVPVGLIVRLLADWRDTRADPSTRSGFRVVRSSTASPSDIRAGWLLRRL